MKRMYSGLLWGGGWGVGVGMYGGASDDYGTHMSASATSTVKILLPQVSFIVFISISRAHDFWFLVWFVIVLCYAFDITT